MTIPTCVEVVMERLRASGKGSEADEVQSAVTKGQSMLPKGKWGHNWFHQDCTDDVARLLIRALCPIGQNVAKAHGCKEAPS